MSDYLFRILATHKIVSNMGTNFFSEKFKNFCKRHVLNLSREQWKLMKTYVYVFSTDKINTTKHWTTKPGQVPF